MFQVIKALSAFTSKAGGIELPTVAQAQEFLDRRHTELKQAPTNEIVRAEVNLYLGAAYRFTFRTGEALVHFKAAYEGYLIFEHPDNVRASALCAWAIAESYIHEGNVAEAKTWYWKALSIYTKVDGIGAESTRACLENFQGNIHGHSAIISSQLRGIERLSDMVAGKG